MASDHSASLRLALRAILNIVLVWILATFFSDYFLLGGGWVGVVAVGALLTLLNIIVRPILDIALLPLKLFAMALAFVAVNGLFVWILLWISDHFDASVATLDIRGGLGGWLMIAIVLGLGNWLMKLTLK